MARETIASVKNEFRGQLKAARAQQEAAIDRIVGVHRIAETDLRKQIADKNQSLQALSHDVKSRDLRIEELLTSNNEYQQKARTAREEVVRLQAALSDAARVISALGQRAEG